MDGVSCVTSGSGWQAREARSIEGTSFAASTLGFMTASVTRQAFALAFLDDEGRSIYSAAIGAQG